MDRKKKDRLQVKIFDHNQRPNAWNSEENKYKKTEVADAELTCLLQMDQLCRFQ